MLLPFAREAGIPEVHLPMYAGASRFLFARKEDIAVRERGGPAAARLSPT